MALRALGRLDEAREAGLSSAQASLRLGWLARAAAAYDFAAMSALGASALSEEKDALEGALSAYEALGDKAEVARELFNLGVAHASLGENAKALSFHERALA